MRAQSSKTSKAINMEDRLRDLIDLVLSSLDDPVDGAALAERAHFSRDHLDRLLAAATGESPVALRRRLLLERAAWQLRAGVPPAEAAEVAGYGSVAAFSRAFSRAYGAPPSAYDGEVQLPAPNGIHFHPPAGLLIPSTPAQRPHRPHGLPPPGPGARAAAGGGVVVGRRSWSGRSGPVWWWCGSRVRSRARR